MRLSSKQNDRAVGALLGAAAGEVRQARGAGIVDNEQKPVQEALQ